jgi:hypothetical protein
MDENEVQELPQYEDTTTIPYDQAPAYEAGTSTSASARASRTALGTTVTIDPTGTSVFELPLGNDKPLYTFSTSLLQAGSFGSIDVSRPDKNTGEPVAIYAIADEFISPLHPVRHAFRNVMVRHSTGVFAAIGLRKVVWDFITQAPIPLKDGKLDPKAKETKEGGTEGNYLVALGGDEVGVQENLLRFYDGKWVDGKDEVLALAREGGAECQGMPVLSVVKGLDQGMVDFLICAWCVALWKVIGKRARRHSRS